MYDTKKGSNKMATKPNSMIRTNLFFTRGIRDGFANLARKRKDGTSAASLVRSVLSAYLGIEAPAEHISFKNTPPAR
jgi:hypothetical protein